MPIILPTVIEPPNPNVPPDLSSLCLNYIGYENLLLTAETAVPTPANVGGEFGEVADALDWKPYTAWKPGAGTVSVEFSYAQQVTMDYLALAYYQFDQMGVLYLDAWNGSAWVNVLSVLGSTEAGRPIFRTFSQTTSDRWRVRVESPAVDIILGVLSAGQWLGVPMQDTGWTPPRLARETKILTNRAEGGLFLGRSLVRAASRFEITATFLRVDWAYDKWLSFIKHAELYPFFFKWNISLAGDAVFCWVDEDIKPSEFVGGYNVDAVLTLRGHAE